MSRNTAWPARCSRVVLTTLALLPTGVGNAEPMAPQPSSSSALHVATSVQESALLPPSAPAVPPAPDPGASTVTAFQSVTLEDSSGQALSNFFAALTRVKRGQGQARVVFYGDSHTAPDLITGRLRQALQAEFGDAGPGFVMPGKPWPHHHHTLVEYGPSKGLTTARINRKVRAGRFGLFGAALKAKNATVRIATRRYAQSSGRASEIELYYLKQPGGGRIQLKLDERVEVISTKARAVGAGYFRLHAKDALHTLELRALDGAVTLLGLTLERKEPGVVLDTLGIPGARAKFHLLWDEALYAEQLQKRAPDLVVLAYGTNEAGDEDLSLADYESTLRKTLTRIQTLVPKTSCLLLGPTDRPERAEDGSFVARAQLTSIIETQRRVAKELGCAFVDVQAAMGGPLSIVRLAQATPPYAARDYVHLTMRGYEALGDGLTTALLDAYRASDK